MVISSRGAHGPAQLNWKALFAPYRNREDNQKRALPQQTLQQGAQTIRFVCRFLHPDYTVGPGVTPGQHSLGVVAGCTASGESHPALKRTFWAEYNAPGCTCQPPISVALSARFMVYWGVIFYFRGVFAMIFSIRDLAFEIGSLYLEGWLALAARCVCALLLFAAGALVSCCCAGSSSPSCRPAAGILPPPPSCCAVWSARWNGWPSSPASTLR